VDDHQCDNITKLKKETTTSSSDEIFNFLIFLVKCTYAFSTFNVEVIIYQILNVKCFWTQFHLLISKIFVIYFYHIKVFQISYTTSYYKSNIGMMVK